MNLCQSMMSSFLTRKPGTFTKSLLILGLALLPASLAHGQLPNFLKELLLDEVILPQNHPSDKYDGAYPEGLDVELNKIARSSASPSTTRRELRDAVDRLWLNNKQAADWFDARLNEIWQRKDGEIDELQSVEQTLQITIAKQNAESDNLRSKAERERASLQNTIAQQKQVLEKLRDELERARQPGEGTENQGVEAQGSSFSLLAIAIITGMGILLLIFLVMWWLAKTKGAQPSDPSKPRQEDTREITRLKREVDGLTGALKEQEANVENDASAREADANKIVEQQKIINELRQENMRLKQG